jgi:hypothetical protein
VLKKRATTNRQIGLMLVAAAFMVVLGFLHNHDLRGTSDRSGPHICFACSVASSVDIETGQTLPDVQEAPAQLAVEAATSDPLSPTLFVFSARAPPVPLS